MKVRVLHHPTIAPGTVIDVSEAVAADFTRTGRGEVYVETAEAAPAPERAARVGKPQTRGNTRRA